MVALLHSCIRNVSVLSSQIVGTQRVAGTLTLLQCELFDWWFWHVARNWNEFSTSKQFYDFANRAPCLLKRYVFRNGCIVVKGGLGNL